MRLGRHAEAGTAFARALGLATNDADRRHLASRLAACKSDVLQSGYK
jgi:predicted RNA polymerase sigma factor